MDDEKMEGLLTTFQRMDTQDNLHLYCDLVHPESGEILAEAGDVLDAQTPRAKHLLAVARDYPEHYYVYTDEDKQTGIFTAEEAER